MSFLGELFSSRTPDYPPLEADSRAGRKVAEVEHEIQELMHKVKQPLEVVPSDHAAYVFIGKPPKKFGLAWIHDGKVSGFNTLIEEHGVTPAEIEKVTEQLRESYLRHDDANHFTTTIDQRKVVVTASDALEREVHEIIDSIVH
ncbi:MAG: hypothetical protein KDI82_05415 [Gammaproteobacteria bacterium]|nr:hypothetical protein [Gammaproteobacteria bacterium]